MIIFRLSDVQEELRVAKQLSESKRMNGEQPDDLATLLSSLKAEHDRVNYSDGLDNHVLS